MKNADLIRELKAAGGILDGIRGLHHVFKHPKRNVRVVVPHPKKDLGTVPVTAMRKQAGF